MLNQKEQLVSVLVHTQTTESISELLPTPRYLCQQVNNDRCTHSIKLAVIEPVFYLLDGLRIEPLVKPVVEPLNMSYTYGSPAGWKQRM